MQVLLDTAVLLEDLSLRSATLGVLISARERLSLDVVVSAVSLDEASQHRIRDIRSAFASACDSVDALTRLSGLPKVATPVPSTDVESAIASVRPRLLARLTELKVTVLPYPAVSHEQIVARIGDRRIPFRKDERGYRDYLIWRSLLERIASPNTIAVITPNWRDFASGEDLAKDLTVELPSGCAAHWYPTVNAFNEAEVLPRLSRVTELETRLTKDEPLQEALLEAVSSVLDRPRLRRTLYAPSSTDLEEIRSFQLLPQPTIDSVTQLATGEYAVALDVELEADVSFGGEYEAIDRIERHHFGRSLPYDTEDWQYRSTEVSLGATVSAQVVLAADLSVASASVLDVSWDDVY